MYAIIINAVAIIIGSAIGALFQRGISEKYVNVLNTAMGLCAITLGMNVSMESMQKTEYPVLFIFCLSIGGLVGTLLKMDQRMDRATRSISATNLAEGITTAILLCCVGTLAMMGPVMSALYDDNTYLMTAATLNFVTVLVLASSYGFGIAFTAIAVFVWMSSIYGIALLSQSLISHELITEVSLVGAFSSPLPAWAFCISRTARPSICCPPSSCLFCSSLCAPFAPTSASISKPHNA